MTIILASQSPRRRDLLARLGLAFDIVPATREERPPRPGEPPEEYARCLAENKAREVAGTHPEAIVLGADTVVTIDGQILGKPKDAADALRMLRLLRGREHRVATGVAVAGSRLHSGVEIARVLMRAAADEELRAYIAGGEPMDKAGAYAVQAYGGKLVVSVYGCHETVVGLPLCLAHRLLTAAGSPPPLPPSCTHEPVSASC